VSQAFNAPEMTSDLKLAIAIVLGVSPLCAAVLLL
jgi:hypothetical protein